MAGENGCGIESTKRENRSTGERENIECRPGGVVRCDVAWESAVARVNVRTVLCGAAIRRRKAVRPVCRRLACVWLEQRNLSNQENCEERRVQVGRWEVPVRLNPRVK